MAMVNVVIIAANRRIYWLRLIGLVQRSAAAWRCVLHSSDEPGELSQWQCMATMTAPSTMSWLLLLLLSLSRLVAPFAWNKPKLLIYTLTRSSHGYIFVQPSHERLRDTCSFRAFWRCLQLPKSKLHASVSSVLIVLVLHLSIIIIIWCSALMLFCCMTVCRPLTARTNDRTHLCIA